MIDSDIVDRIDDIERLTRQPGRLHAQIVSAAGAKLSEAVQAAS